MSQLPVTGSPNKTVSALLLRDHSDMGTFAPNGKWSRGLWSHIRNRYSDRIESFLRSREVMRLRVTVCRAHALVAGSLMVMNGWSARVGGCIRNVTVDCHVRCSRRR